MGQIECLEFVIQKVTLLCCAAQMPSNGRVVLAKPQSWDVRPKQNCKTQKYGWQLTGASHSQPDHLRPPVQLQLTQHSSACFVCALSVSGAWGWPVQGNMHNTQAEASKPVPSGAALYVWDGRDGFHGRGCVAPILAEDDGFSNLHQLTNALGLLSPLRSSDHAAMSDFAGLWGRVLLRGTHLEGGAAGRTPVSLSMLQACFLGLA
eukprot:1156896-Pelagomonas_calceolata.AAC.4